MGERVVRLIFSNALEPLTAALARDIDQWRAGDLGRLLCPLQIVVPDRLVARYLNLEIARIHGASVNLRFPFLSSVLEASLAAPVRERVLTRERITERVAALLGEDSMLEREVMKPARGYVQTGDDESSGRRRAELALELSRLYLEYASSRPTDFVRFSASGDEFGGERFAWQRELWREVCAPQAGEASDSDQAEPRATLFELIAKAGPEDLTPPPVLFIVGASNTSPAQRLMLERIGQHTDIYIYAFNACREYWEDLEKSPDECPALAYWGRAGRAPVRQLSELTDFDFESRFVEPTDDTVLGRIKGDILNREARSDSRTPLANDESLRILSAPSIHRELEYIGESIWQLARDHPDLSLRDVGVLLAGSESDLYRAQTGSVFGSLAQLPHHISLVPLTEESRVAEAISALLELALGSFTRPQMLHVLTHPAISGGSGDIDTADWVKWVRDLGVFFGDDASAYRGTYLEGDVYHWDQALLRLSVGACVERDPMGNPVGLANRSILPHELTPGRRKSGGRFALLARSLIADIVWLRDQSMPLAAWADVLWRYASAYVEARTDRQRTELGRCRNALSRIGDPASRDRLPLATAVELARAALATLETRRGEPLTEGVCVAPLSSPPLVPFRFLFIAGLSSGAFPRTDAAGIDARKSNRRAAEPSASERDRYTFLHALLCAREAVTVSYVGRDPLSGETLAPSSVVAELRALAIRELGDQAAAKLTTTIEPWAHRDANTEARGVNLHARRRARALALAPTGASVRVSRSRRRNIERLRGRTGTRTRSILGLTENISAPGHLRDRELSSSDLARFLESPIDAWGRTVLGLGSAPESNRGVATEPLDLSRLDRSIMMRDAVCGLAIEGPAGGDLEARLFASADRILRRGTGPSGAVARWQVEAALAAAEQWWARYTELDTIEQPTSLAIGRARENANIHELLPPLLVGGDPVVEAHGLFPLIAADASAMVYFHSGASAPAGRAPRALIDHLLLAASGRATDTTIKVHLVGPQRSETLEIDGFSATDAHKFLEHLASELLANAHAYELPGAALFDNHLRGKPATDRIAEIALKPIPDYAMIVRRLPGDFSLPDNLAAVLEGRYQPLLSRLRRRA